MELKGHIFLVWLFLFDNKTVICLI